MCLAAAVVVAAAVGAQENRIRTLQDALLNTWENHRADIEAVDTSLCFPELQHAMSIVSQCNGPPTASNMISRLLTTVCQLHLLV